MAKYLTYNKDSDFTEEDYVLNYKPVIEFIEPDSSYIEQIPDEKPKVETTENTRDRMQKLINGLDQLKKLFNTAQQRVDNRVKASGGVTIQLDKVKDAHVIDAIRRRFPNKADPTQLTYEDYRDAIDCVNGTVNTEYPITSKEMDEALNDPNRIDFGGYENQKGENRQEIASEKVVDPVDLDEFKKASIIALFLLLLPLIKKSESESILQHLVTAPHSPI